MKKLPSTLGELIILLFLLSDSSSNSGTTWLEIN